MNLSEFKAWFEGFTENLDGAPDKKQWAKIEAKVKLIKDAPATPHTVFVDRYYPLYQNWPYWRSTTYAGGCGTTLQGQQGQNYQERNNYQSMAGGILGNPAGGNGHLANLGAEAHQQQTADWNAAVAFRQLGRMEAAS